MTCCISCANLVPPLAIPSVVRPLFDVALCVTNLEVWCRTCLFVSIDGMILFLLEYTYASAAVLIDVSRYDISLEFPSHP